MLVYISVGTASDVTMAMKLACESGRLAFLSGRIPKRLYAKASSPELEHFCDVFTKGLCRN